MRTIFNRLFPAIFLLPVSCKKLVSISDPTDRITTNQAFTNNELANTAMNGVYFSLAARSSDATGFISVFSALSSDEAIIIRGMGLQDVLINTNHLVVTPSPNGENSSPTDNIWKWAYNVIYAANAVIEGIAASSSPDLSDSARSQITAESKCIRAFCYFYLTNFYGDIPLVLNTDYYTNILAPRTPQPKVYQQIINDLKEAQNNLPSDYAFNGGKRTRMNKWAATAILARTYLYTKDYPNAAAAATAVIDNAGLYILEPTPNNTFLTGSREAIWQLNHITSSGDNNATAEGALFLPLNGTLNAGPLAYGISQSLLNAFEPGDLRRQQWIDSVSFDNANNGVLITYYCPYKYKIGVFNAVTGGTASEYTTPIRLAELYLIRAEAEMNGAPGGTAAAIADLNTLRARATLPALPTGLSQEALTAALEKEWRTEYFCEMGHRWFNLKRTGEAHSILSALPLKQPWAGDTQLLYPLPLKDLKLDPNLVQNPGY